MESLEDGVLYSRTFFLTSYPLRFMPFALRITPYTLFSFIENPFGLEGCPLQTAEVFDADFRGNQEFFLERLL